MNLAQKDNSAPAENERARASARQLRRQLRRDRLDHRVDDFDVAGEEIATGGNAVASDEIAVAAAGFADQQAASGHVPWLQADFVEAIDASGCDIRDVERG